MIKRIILFAIVFGIFLFLLNILPGLVSDISQYGPGVFRTMSTADYVMILLPFFLVALLVSSIFVGVFYLLHHRTQGLPDSLIAQGCLLSLPFIGSAVLVLYANSLRVHWDGMDTAIPFFILLSCNLIWYLLVARFFARDQEGQEIPGLIITAFITQALAIGLQISYSPSSCPSSAGVLNLLIKQGLYLQKALLHSLLLTVIIAFASHHLGKAGYGQSLKPSGKKLLLAGALILPFLLALFTSSYMQRSPFNALFSIISFVLFQPIFPLFVLPRCSLLLWGMRHSIPIVASAIYCYLIACLILELRNKE